LGGDGVHPKQDTDVIPALSQSFLLIGEKG
jgi:hypothetical protein